MDGAGRGIPDQQLRHAVGVADRQAPRLLEELGELEEAWSTTPVEDGEACVDALCDIAVYGIGAMRILGAEVVALDAIPTERARTPMIGPLLRSAGRLAKAHKSGDAGAALVAATELVELCILRLRDFMRDPHKEIARVVQQNATREHTGTHG